MAESDRLPDQLRKRDLSSRRQMGEVVKEEPASDRISRERGSSRRRRDDLGREIQLLPPGCDPREGVLTIPIGILAWSQLEQRSLLRTGEKPSHAGRMWLRPRAAQPRWTKSRRTVRPQGAGPVARVNPRPRLG